MAMIEFEGYDSGLLLRFAQLVAREQQGTTVMRRKLPPERKDRDQPGRPHRPRRWVRLFAADNYPIFDA